MVQEWQNVRSNKLRDIKITVSPRPSFTQKIRKYEIVLAKLKLRHTLLTHKTLWRKDTHLTVDCLVPLTVKHVLAECPSYQQHIL